MVFAPETGVPEQAKNAVMILVYVIDSMTTVWKTGIKNLLSCKLIQIVLFEFLIVFLTC